MRDLLLRLAFAGTAPERIDRLIGSHGVEGAVEGIASGRLECHAGARERVRSQAPDLEKALAGGGIRFLANSEEAFPDCLRPLPAAPRWLFVRGELPRLPGVAVVGSRRATDYGLALAAKIGGLIGAAGWPVVSGLAAGIDGAAHRGCLDAGGCAVAVLGSGIDVWYPTRNRPLGERILRSGGAVVSEFPPGTPPDAWRFPCRNRVISGLSSVVIVVEAAERSGALITARLALEQGRDVLAVPGDIDRETSRGCNQLIRDGAHPVTSLGEVVELVELILGPAPSSQVREEGEVLGGLVGPVPVALEELAEKAERPLVELLTELARLELEGSIRIEDGAVRTL